MKRFACVLMLLSAALLAGCPERGPAAPPVAKVSGTVLLDGKPMEDGRVVFNAPGRPGKSLDVKAGAFEGEVFTGPNQVDVIRENDERPHPMDPAKKVKVNTVDSQFSGPNTPFKPEVTASGATDLKFEVTSARN